MTLKRDLSAIPALALALTITAPLWIAGCLKVDAKFDANGGGTMKLVMSEVDDAAHVRLQKNLVSPAVKLVSATHEGNVGTYVVSFEDAKKLRTAPVFSQVRIQYSDLENARRSLSMTLPRREKSKNDDTSKENEVAIDLNVTLPGKITETNGTKVSDTQANWQILVKDMIGTGRIGSRSVYEVSGKAAEPQKADSAAAVGGQPASD